MDSIHYTPGPIYRVGLAFVSLLIKFFHMFSCRIPPQLFYFEYFIRVDDFFHTSCLFISDLMAQRLARRAEDREVPGSSPTQD